MPVSDYISLLAAYAVNNKLLDARDKVWAINSILAQLGLDAFSPRPETALPPQNLNLAEILSGIADWAAAQGKIADWPGARERLETALMGLLLAPPSVFIRQFRSIKKHKGIRAATSWMYEIQRKANYIKTEGIAKNIVWPAPSQYGTLDITINLTKPEKSPKEIAAIKELPPVNHTYPPCLLCRENEGYRGRLDYPPRQNIRLIPLRLLGERWYFQYSPYVYYHEHCIVLSETHADMRLNAKTFARLLAFLEQFPHYFIGSNADLPIVGGSILNHDHYQGGNYIFPMHRAAIRQTFRLARYPRLECEVLRWPLTVFRFTGEKRDLLGAAEFLLDKWRNYSDEPAQIIAHSGAAGHNTLTPMARIAEGRFQLDLALRNNRTTPEFPDGIFHSHPEYHHIKKENIGLIEVMGLAILPGRLKEELDIVGKALANSEPESLENLQSLTAAPATARHYPWALELAGRHKFTHDNREALIKAETARRFVQVLECCGVFKNDAAGSAALARFISSLNR